MEREMCSYLDLIPLWFSLNKRRRRSYQSASNANLTCTIVSHVLCRVQLPKDAPVIRSRTIVTHSSSPPDTPEVSCLASTSPTSSVSPQTPPNAHGSGLLTQLPLQYRHSHLVFSCLKTLQLSQVCPSSHPSQ